MIAGVFYPVEQVSILLRQDVHFKLLEDLSSLEMLQRPDQFKGNYFNNLFSKHKNTALAGLFISYKTVTMHSAKGVLTIYQANEVKRTR